MKVHPQPRLPNSLSRTPFFRFLTLSPSWPYLAQANQEWHLIFTVLTQAHVKFHKQPNPTQPLFPTPFGGRLAACTCSSTGALWEPSAATSTPLAILTRPSALPPVVCSGVVRCARYCITILALSVFPAPDSPLIKMAWRCSSIIIAVKAWPSQTLRVNGPKM